MYDAIVAVLKQLGGSATRREIDEGVAEHMSLSDEQISQLHDKKGTRTRLNYNLAWSRTYLKATGILNNSERGIWLLTTKGYALKNIDKAKIKANVRKKQPRGGEKSQTANLSVATESDDYEVWRNALIETILELPPDGFERLCQYILRESGFIEVEVLGKSGDGGIDGKGNMQLSGLLKFQCYFQCKRWRGSVGSKDIRDFRGAMVGRSDKGLFITTGGFTKAAQEEASRDGAPPIDLIDGEMLLDKMQELELGLKQSIIYKVDKNWFQQFKQSRADGDS